MNVHDSWVGALGAAAGGVCTAIAAWINHPKRKAPRVEQSEVNRNEAEAAERISAAFTALVDDLRTELRNERTANEKVATELRRQVSILAAGVRKLTTHIESLEATMRAKGIDTPPRPDMSDIGTIA